MTLVLSRLSVGSQINLLSALGVVGLIIAGAIYYDGSTKVAAQQELAAQAMATERLATRADFDLLLARRAEKDFLLRLEPSYVEAHARLRSSLSETLASLKQRLSVGGRSDLANQTDGLQSGVARYFNQFVTVTELQTRLGLNENTGLQGALREAVHAVETKLAKTTEPQLTILTLMMRRHEKDFIARRDPSYTAQMTTRGNEFAAALAATTLPDATKREMAADMARYQATFADFAKGTLALGSEIKELSRFYSEIEPVVQSISKNVQAIYVDARQSAEQRQTETSRLIAVAILVITVVVGLVGWMIGRGIRGPLLRLADIMRRLAEGEHGIVVAASDRRGEIGSMSRAVLVFRDGLVEGDRLRADQESQRAQAEQDRRQLLASLADECEDSMGQVANAVSSSAAQLRTAAEMLSGAAGRAAERSSAVSVGATETSANVQTVAAATEELTHSIEEITRQVADASSIAATAVAEAEVTNNTVGSLNNAAERIGSVVTLITQIANQTNLLALNATIEAARAGEAGKGFAVVAAEVKSLAGQTARATSEIQSHVMAIQQESGQATQAIGDIGGTIARLNEISVAVAAAVRQQSAATAEISRNVQQAAQATEQVTEHIADVEESTRITGNSAGELLGAAQGLTDQAVNLQRNVSALGARIRAA